MRLLTLMLFIFTLSLHADSTLQSDVVIEKESYALEHEFIYGVTNNYSLLSIEHQILAQGALLFHYGTCVGVVVEDYTATNGFGPNADEFGLVLEANVGLDYRLKEYQTITFECTHSEKKILDEAESRVNFRYQYKF